MMNQAKARIPTPLIALVIVLSTLGCGSVLARTISTVELEPMRFEHPGAPIDGTIELCLSPKLRMRQWNIANHPYKIALGSRTALNVEILAKSAFREVIVSFDGACGTATHHPWLSATILAANRDWDSLLSAEQNTTITMEFELADDDAHPIWSATTRGNISSPSSLPTRRRTRAAQDFGEAIALALQRAFKELVESEEVRSAFKEAPEAS
ncbi:MAG: hypothetical protein GY910_03375 [bacterium]|nr:hypothetical protein [Deltaproteobacteria bacterium]MCP4903998.1 hypothetical protein [bacterium]